MGRVGTAVVDRDDRALSTVGRSINAYAMPTLSGLNAAGGALLEPFLSRS